MPFPSRRDYIRMRQSTASAGIWTLQIPRPAGALEGDIIIAHMCFGRNNVTVSSLGGWQLLKNQVVNTRTLVTVARRYLEDDPTTYPLTVNAASADTGVELSSMAISDAADISDWTIGTLWRRQDNGGTQSVTQSPSIIAPTESLILALEIEATLVAEADGAEVIIGATKWFGSPTQTTDNTSIERVLVSYNEISISSATPVVTTTWPNSAANGAGFQVAIPYELNGAETTEYIKDSFDRVLNDETWGAAEKGGNWTRLNSGEQLTVSDGTANMLLAASQSNGARLNSVSLTEHEMYVEWATDIVPAGGLVRPRFVTRYINGVGDYHIRASVTSSATTDFRWYRDDTAALGTTVTLSGTYTPGQMIKLRMQTFPDGTNTTRLRARMWYAADPEPTTWALDLTDSTPAYQAPGVISLFAGIGSTVTNGPVKVSFDNLLVTERPPDATTTTGNIGLHVIPYFTQTSLRVGAKFIQNSLVNEVRLYSMADQLIDTKTATIGVSKWASVDFTELAPDTQYTIKFFVDSVEQTDAEFTVRTLAQETSHFVAVAGSCQFTGSSHPIFTRMAEDTPAFIAHMGDLQYQDATDETSWRGAVESSLGSSTMRPMLETVPFSWTWDNHDRIIVDTLNMGSTSPLTVPAWQEVAGTTGWSSSDTMGRSWTMGRVRFIQTDQWSVRDDPDLVAEPRTFLGATQKQWWKDTLLASKEPVILWFCQWTAQNHANGRWNSFNAETTELEAWLNAHPSIKQRLIMVGGDSHQLQADSGTRTAAQGSRFSGVPSLNVSGFNRSSVGANGQNWDIAEGDVRISSDLEANWGAYSRLTFNDDGATIDMLWEAVRVNALGATDIMASWRRKTGTVVIDGETAVAQYYRIDQNRVQPLSIELP